MTTTAADLIADHADRLTDYVVDEDYRRRPELEARYGEDGRALYRRDNHFHLSFLREAVASNEPALFADYVGWARSMLLAHGVLVEDLHINLDLLCEALQQLLPAEASAQAVATVRDAQRQLPSLPAQPATFMADDGSNVELARAYLEHLLAGNRKQASDLVSEAVAGGLSLQALYLDVFQRSQRELGRLWQLNRITVAEEHFCTAATQSIMNQCYRQILETPRNGLRVTALCIAGDLHEIGLRVIADFFELAGWDCDYLGANTPIASVLTQLEKRRPDLLAISATMPYHVRPVAELIDALRANPSLVDIPVLVGGRPFLVSADLWRKIGADGWAADAESAVARGLELVERGRRGD